MLIKIKKSKKINFFLKNKHNHCFFDTYINLYKFINIKFVFKCKHKKRQFFLSKYFFLQNFFFTKKFVILNNLMCNYIKIIKNVKMTKFEYFYNFNKNIVNYLICFVVKFFLQLNNRDIWQRGLYFFFKESNLFYQKKLGMRRRNRKKKIYKSFINTSYIKSILPSINNFNKSHVFFLSNFKKAYPQLRRIKFCDYGNRFKSAINKNILRYSYSKFLKFYYNYYKNTFFDKKYFQYLYSTRILNKFSLLTDFVNISNKVLPLIILKKKINKLYFACYKLKIYCEGREQKYPLFNFFFRVKANFYLTKYCKIKYKFKKSYASFLKKRKIKYFKFFFFKTRKKNLSFFKSKNKKVYFSVLKNIYFNNFIFKHKKYIKIKKFFYFYIFFRYYSFNIYFTKKKKKFYRRRFLYRLKFLRRKWNFFRFFKINLRFIVSSLFAKLKKKFISNFKNYLNFLFFNIYNKDLNINTTVKKNLITSVKMLNLLQFNKFSLLSVNKLNIYKYINVFINNLYIYFLKKITNINAAKVSIFKYIYVYLKSLAKRKNFNYFNINIKNINKLKNKRKSFICNFFSFYSSKRFYLNKFNLLFIWKKINIDFLFSKVLKKYRHVHSYIYSFNTVNTVASFFFSSNIKFFFNKRSLYFDYYNSSSLLNFNFQNTLKLKYTTDKLNIYKQFFYFFNNLKKHLLINFVKNQDNKFFYKKSFLSWNMFAFWKFYIVFLSFFNNRLQNNKVHDLRYFFSYIYNLENLSNISTQNTNMAGIDFKALQVNIFKNLKIFNNNEVNSAFFFNNLFSVYLKFLLKKKILFYKKNWRNLLYKYNSCFYFYRKIFKKFFSKWSKKKSSLFFFNKKEKGLKRFKKDVTRNFILSNKKSQYTGFFFFKQWHHKIYRKLFYKLRSKLKNKLKFKKNLILKKKKNLKKSILRLRVKYVFRLKKYLNLYNTCSYYNYFKRRLYKRKKTYKFFFNFFKKNYRKKQILKKKNIVSQIGIISIIIFLNNTYVTLTDVYGNVLFVRSGGLVGIKGPNRSTSVTSEEVTSNVCTFVQKKKIKFLILKFSGVLYSRKIKAALKVFNFFKKLKILKVINNTPKSHNGIRLKKKKRL